MHLAPVSTIPLWPQETKLVAQLEVPALKELSNIDSTRNDRVELCTVSRDEVVHRRPSTGPGSSFDHGVHTSSNTRFRHGTSTARLRRSRTTIRACTSDTDACRIYGL